MGEIKEKKVERPMPFRWEERTYEEKRESIIAGIISAFFILLMLGIILLPRFIEWLVRIGIE